MSNEKYNGQWILIPELCIYQNGEPPASGSYEIQTGETDTHFKIEWTDQSGVSHSVNFSGTADGDKYESDTPGVTHVIYEKISDMILDSTAFDGDKVLLYARRVASLNGELLAVSQVAHAEGGNFTNIQIYRRMGT